MIISSSIFNTLGLMLSSSRCFFNDSVDLKLLFLLPHTVLLLFGPQIDDPYVNIGIIFALKSVISISFDGYSKLPDEQSLFIANKAAFALAILFSIAKVNLPFC